MVPDQCGDRVEALMLQHVLDFGLAAFDQDFADPTVDHFLLPATREHIVAHGRQGVPYEKVAAS